jgi:allantoin racemase
MRVLLINPNTNRATTETMVEIARASDPQARVNGATARTGAPLLVDEALLAQGAAAVVELVRATDFASFDGGIVAAFGDPGLEAARAICRVPLVGIAEAAMAEAATDGRRFVVVTTTPHLVNAIERRAAVYGCGAGFGGVRLTDGDINVLMADPSALEAALAQACERTIAEDGTKAIVIGGGPLAFAARTLAPRFAVPIIEPIPAAMRLLRARLAAPCDDISLATRVDDAAATTAAKS